MSKQRIYSFAGHKTKITWESVKSVASVLSALGILVTAVNYFESFDRRLSVIEARLEIVVDIIKKKNEI